MPPKKKKGGKGGRKKAAAIVDGLSPNEMSPAQLLGHIKRLQTEIDREREERNFFMLEREKLFTLWNLAVEQLAEEKQKARLVDVQMEQGKKDAKNEMDLYKQKLRFLQAEQSKKLGLVRLNHLEKMRKVQDEIWAIQLLMKESLQAKKRQYRNAQISLFELLRRMHMEHADKTSAMRKQFAEEIRRIEMEMDRQLERDRESMELETRKEIEKLVQLKSDQLQRMMANHSKQVLDMKTFYNDLAVNNLAVITSLQNDIANKKIEEQRLKRELESSKAKYFEILGSVKDMERQMEEWGEEVVDTEALSTELKTVTTQLESNQRYTRMIEVANEALSQRIELMKQENENFKKEFVKQLLIIQRRVSMKRLVKDLKSTKTGEEALMLKFMNEVKAKCLAKGMTADEYQDHLVVMIQEYLARRDERLHELETCEPSNNKAEDGYGRERCTDESSGPAPTGDAECCIVRKRNVPRMSHSKSLSSTSPAPEETRGSAGGPGPEAGGRATQSAHAARASAAKAGTGMHEFGMDE